MLGLAGTRLEVASRHRPTVRSAGVLELTRFGGHLASWEDPHDAEGNAPVSAGAPAKARQEAKVATTYGVERSSHSTKAVNRPPHHFAPDPTLKQL